MPPTRYLATVTVPQSTSIAVFLRTLTDNDRARAAAIFTLDGRLEQLARYTRDPLVAQMRLTWWFEALRRLDEAPPPAEPLLQTVAADILPCGVTGAQLGEIAEGWSAVLDEHPDLDAFAILRGKAVFMALSRCLGVDHAAIGAAGEAWALADYAADHAGASGQRAAKLAGSRLDAALVHRWPAAARGLGSLAMMTVTGATSRSGTRAALGDTFRVMRFRLTGR